MKGKTLILISILLFVIIIGCDNNIDDVCGRNDTDDTGNTDDEITRLSIPISDLAGLKNIDPECSHCDYILINDIEPNTNPSSNWEPIPELRGTLNGNGHSIKDLQIIQEDANYVGLFKKIARGAKIENLTIHNITVQNAGDYVGIIAGDNKGIITHINITNTVNNKNNNNYIGGLVGRNSGTIKDCVSQARVRDNKDNVGGLVGLNNYEGSIIDSSVRETITGINSIGGIAGMNKGIIRNCYSRGMLRGTSYVGGITGTNLASGIIEHSNTFIRVIGTRYFGGIVGTNMGHISKCFTKGNVTQKKNSQGQYAGGLAGNNQGGTIEYSYTLFPNSGVGGLIQEEENKIASIQYSGGLVGENGEEGIIRNCYTTMISSGSNYVGGFVGNNKASIINSYSAGGIITKENNYIGNFAGNNAGTMTDCYHTKKQDSTIARNFTSLRRERPYYFPFTKPGTIKFALEDGFILVNSTCTDSNTIESCKIERSLFPNWSGFIWAFSKGRWPQLLW